MDVCAIDELASKKLNKKFEYGFVVNLSHSSESGSHWIGLYVKRKRGTTDSFYATYCDSFGFPAKSFYLQDFIKKKCKKVEYNDRQFQQLSSKVCGMYASCFILHMAEGGTLKSFADKFSKNLRLNDILIEKYYNYLMRNSEVRKFLAKKKQLLELKRKNLRKKMLSFRINKKKKM